MIYYYSRCIKSANMGIGPSTAVINGSHRTIHHPANLESRPDYLAAKDDTSSSWDSRGTPWRPAQAHSTPILGEYAVSRSVEDVANFEIMLMVEHIGCNLGNHDSNHKLRSWRVTCACDEAHTNTPFIWGSPNVITRPDDRPRRPKCFLEIEFLKAINWQTVDGMQSQV